MMSIVGFLPPPPGTTESSSDGGPSTLLVLVLVALILGGVIFVAWLLKPIVAKRIRGQETPANPNSGTASGVANARWNDNWSGSQVAANEEEAEGRSIDEPPPFSEVVPDATEPADESERENTPAFVLSVSESLFDAPAAEDDLQSELRADEDNETTDIVAITATVRALLARANAGRVREGFALYSESALQRFRDDTGFTAEEFDRAFDAVEPPPVDQQAELAAITDIDRLPDGRIRALISYGNGGTYPPPEYFTFVRSADDEWLIDEIASVEG